MLAILVLVLVVLAIAAVAAWWFLDFDMPEIVLPVAAPGIGASIIYVYGTMLAWAIGLALFAATGFFVYRLVGRNRARGQPK